MRYSTIHHDVRERFGLNLNQYAVADSIHQLSHRGPTKKANTEIAKFLGLEETTIRRAKLFLVDKGLIEEIEDGFCTTEIWYDAVTNARQKADDSAKSRGNRLTAESHLIYKESNNSEDKSSPSFQIVNTPVDQYGNELEIKKKIPPWRKDPLFVSALALASKEAGFSVQSTKWDYESVRKAQKFLGDDKHVLWCIESVLTRYGSQQHKYSLAKMLSATHLNEYKADL